MAFSYQQSAFSFLMMLLDSMRVAESFENFIPSNGEDLNLDR
jgi:hypothetical protein